MAASVRRMWQTAGVNIFSRLLGRKGGLPSGGGGTIVLREEREGSPLIVCLPQGEPKALQKHPPSCPLQMHAVCGRALRFVAAQVQAMLRDLPVPSAPPQPPLDAVAAVAAAAELLDLKRQLAEREAALARASGALEAAEAGRREAEQQAREGARWDGGVGGSGLAACARAGS